MTRGLVLGKFLPYHAGHAHLIRTARAQVDELTVLVCSLSSEPIDGSLRHSWVASEHPDCRVIHVAEELPQTPDEHPAFWDMWREVIGRRAGPVDVVFTSEDYGEELARWLNARHVCVDRERRAVPISGTSVRADPYGHWAFLPTVVRPFYVRRVAILGDESTGKTTLASQLASAFDTVWVPEYGRTYCGTRDPRTLSLDDFERIGRGQLAAEDSAAREANCLLFCDTDLLTTCTWSDMIAGSRPPWLAATAERRRYERVFLLAADVPWINDGTRVLADRRAEHTARLRHELERVGQPYDELHGPFDARLGSACRLIRSMTELRDAGIGAAAS